MPGEARTLTVESRCAMALLALRDDEDMDDADDDLEGSRRAQKLDDDRKIQADKAKIAMQASAEQGNKAVAAVEQVTTKLLEKDDKKEDPATIATTMMQSVMGLPSQEQCFQI